MTTNLRYAVVKSDGSIEVIDGPFDVGTAQEIVGGDFTSLPQPHEWPVTLLAHAEGRVVGLEPNWPVTALIRRSIQPSDFVTGTVIVAGPPDSEGDLTSLSIEDEKRLRESVSE